MALPVTLTPQSLNPGICYTSEQRRLNDFVQHIAAELGINFTPTLLQSTAPGPDDRDKIWVQVDGSNAIQDILTFSNGAWNGIPKPWIPGEFKYYDPALYVPAAPWFPCDGSVSLVNAQNVGVPDLRGRFLVASGMRIAPAAQTFTNPDGTTVSRTDSTTNFLAGNTGGEEQHVLIKGELPNYSLALNLLQGDAGIGRGDGAQAIAAQSILAELDLGGTFNPHNNIPPYYVLAIMQWRPDLAAL